MQTPTSTSIESAHKPVRVVSSSLAHFIHTYIWLKFESCFSSHPHSHPCVRSLRFGFLFLLPSSCRLCSSSFSSSSPNKKFMANLYNSAKEGVDTIDVFSFTTIPGGVGLKMGRHVVFFTVVNPMDNQDGFGETLCYLSQARIGPYKKLGNAFRIQSFGAV